ncbi:MAG: transposase [Bacteroidetes bacterium]|nr:transposase [Bacteroidota bacterium]MBT5529399.1 transposase [Cytophagia bacterium]
MPSKYTIQNHQNPHFLTYSTVEWIEIFTRSIYKDIVVDSLKHCQNEKGLILYAWVIMSNHVHLIASAKENYKLSDILRDHKKFTSKRIIEALNHPEESRRNWILWLLKSHGEKNSNNKNYQVWQQNNHPVELETNKMIDQRLDYLHNNPVKAGLVNIPEEYTYSSAIDYVGGKGLLDIEFIV